MTIRKRGPYQYQAIVRLKGHTPQSKTFETEAEAHRWKLETVEALRDGTWYGARRATETTLRDALLAYANGPARQQRGSAVETGRAKRLVGIEVASLTLARLSASDLAAWRDARLDDAAAGTVARELGVLRRAIEHMRDEHGVTISENPADRIRKPRGGKRDRRLYDGEEVRLLAAAEPAAGHPGHHNHPSRTRWQRPLLIAALETAARRGELLAWRWEWIDWERRIISLPGAVTKTGQARSLPMTPRLRRMLNEVGTASAGPVWGDVTADALSQAWQRTLARARHAYEAECDSACIPAEPHYLTDLRWHDLRHEAVSRLVESGLSLLEVQQVSGHASLAMLERYTHLQTAHIVSRLAVLRPDDDPIPDKWANGGVINA